MVSQLLHPLVAEGLGVASSQQPRLRTKKATFGILSTAKLAPLSGQRLAYALAFRISAGAAGLNVSWPRLSGCLRSSKNEDRGLASVAGGVKLRFVSPGIDATHALQLFSCWLQGPQQLPAASQCSAWSSGCMDHHKDSGANSHGMKRSVAVQGWRISGTL